MKTVEELYEQMRADFSARIGTAVGDGCDLAARMYALAAQIYALQVHSDWVRRQCFPQTAQGENLDHHAQMRSLERKKATRAAGVVRFCAQIAAETVRSIPAGTVCMTAGLVRFETAQDAVLAAGEMWVDVPVQAVEPGQAGNVPAGSITAMAVAPVGIASCTNLAPCSGGVDEEDDESLRARILDTFRSLPNGTNAAYYRQLALSDDEVAAAVVVSRPRGVGSVDVVVSSHAGVPGEELLNRLSASIGEQREIAVDVQVLAPVEEAANVAAAVAAEDGYSFEEVRIRVEQALAAFFNGRLLGKGVRVAELNSLIFQLEGVQNVKLSAPAADIAARQGVLPKAGTVSITEMEA